MFEQIVNTTPCPFTARAKWVELSLQNDSAQPSRMTRRTEKLVNLLPALEASGIDMVAIPLASGGSLTNMTEFTETVSHFMKCLFQTSGSSTPTEAELLAPGWQLELRGIELFALSFAPLYPVKHPRFSPCGLEYIVLQLERSFTRHGISSAHRARHEVSQMVESRFRGQGYPYFAELTRSKSKAFRLIKPINESDPPIQWWKEMVVR